MGSNYGSENNITLILNWNLKLWAWTSLYKTDQDHNDSNSYVKLIDS